jgi:hypothetical protein
MQQIISTLNKMADIVADMATVGARLKSDWEEVRKRFHPNNEAAEDIH